MLSQSTV
jgi:hypothetical protein